MSRRSWNNGGGEWRRGDEKRCCWCWRLVVSLEPVAFRGDWRPGLVNPVDLALVGVVQGLSSVGIHGPWILR